MPNDTDVLRQQRQLRELSASVTRALADDPAVYIRQHHFFKAHRALNQYAPHLRLQDDEKLEFIRGVADSLALRLQYSDAALHQQGMPQQPVARLIFDWLESLRVESLAPEHLPGVRRNLQHRFYYWSAGFHHAGYTDTALGLLLYTVAQMCWSRLTGLPVYPETEDFIESTRHALSAQLGHNLAALRRHRLDQHAYAPYALAIAEQLDQSVEHALANQKSDKEEDEQSLTAFSLLLDIDGGLEGDIHVAHPDTSPTLEALNNEYLVFDRQYDTQRYVADQVRPELLHQYRERINKRIAAQNLSFNLLVHRIRRALTTATTQRWVADEEEGLIDGRRLSQLISSPLERRLFKQPQQQLMNHSSVSFLIDCSGSMKDNAETVCLIVDMLSRALERSGAATEVLGYSTNAWNGGRPYRRWQAGGRKPHPGRLNEVDHRVFKEASTPWKRANLAIMALLKLDLYREGIDGEAVQWACERLLRQSSQRKLLYVISDGSPMDSATNLANDEHYLSSHLRQMLLQYQQQGVEICGIGVNLDLSLLYQRSIIADLHKGLDNYFIDEFIRSLAPAKGKR